MFDEVVEVGLSDTREANEQALKVLVMFGEVENVGVGGEPIFALVLVKDFEDEGVGVDFGDAGEEALADAEGGSAKYLMLLDRGKGEGDAADVVEVHDPVPFIHVN